MTLMYTVLKNDSTKYQIYKEKVYLISICPQSINDLYEIQQQSLYIQSLGQKLLCEKYLALELNPDIISNTLQLALYKCREANQLKNTDILATLNSIFLKVGIIFEIDNITKYPRYPEAGIVRGETDTSITIFVNNKFFDIFKSMNLTKQDENTKRLGNSIFKMYAHEATHLNQKNIEKKIQPGIDNPDDRYSYLSNKREIDAHAREFANRLILSNLKFGEILNLIKTNSKKLLSDEIWEEYWRYFGAYITNSKDSYTPDTYKRINVFNRFKRRVFDFLMLDRVYMSNGNKIDVLNKLIPTNFYEEF